MSSELRHLLPALAFALLVIVTALAATPATAQTAVRTASPITVADASLSAAFYSDSSCLLTIDSSSRPGKTVIDANVDGEVSRMLIHCDTVDGRRLTLLARGDALNVAQRAPLLSREEIEEGDVGMIAWLTRSGVHYSDDSAPRRYVIAGSVFLRKSPPVQASGNALHSQRHAFGRLVGILEPLLKSKNPTISTEMPVVDDQNSEPGSNSGSEPESSSDSDSGAPPVDSGTSSGTGSDGGNRGGLTDMETEVDPTGSQPTPEAVDEADVPSESDSADTDDTGAPEPEPEQEPEPEPVPTSES